jgi:hypothetical protein
MLVRQVQVLRASERVIKLGSNSRKYQGAIGDKKKEEAAGNSTSREDMQAMWQHPSQNIFFLNTASKVFKQPPPRPESVHWGGCALYHHFSKNRPLASPNMATAFARASVIFVTDDQRRIREPRCPSSDSLDLRCQTIALQTLHSNAWLTRNY